MASRTPLLLLIVLVGLAVGGWPPHRGHAQGFTDSDPVGIVTIPLPAQSDTRVSIPFVRPAPYAGTIQSVTGGNVLTVTDAPNWSANRFAFNANAGQHDTFFILLGKNPGASGPAPREGCFYTVTANGANTLTLDLNGDDLSAVQPGTHMTLIPYWTLATAFPAGDAGRSFLASASARKLATTLALPESTSTMVNGPSGIYLGPKPPAPPVYYFSAGAWRNSANPDPGTVCDDDVLYPDAHFIVRNNATTALAFRPTGVVLMGKLTAPVPTPDADSTLEYPAGLPRPLAMTLDASGLRTSGTVRSVEETDADAIDDYDTVALYDPLGAGYNPEPLAYYFFAGGIWRKSGAYPIKNAGGIPLMPGAGFILHKAPADGATVFWQNAPNYPAATP